MLPDINVWLALIVDDHVHSARARSSYEMLNDAEVHYCRITQLGVLRLLTNEAVMGRRTCTLKQAWERWLQVESDERIHFRAEAEQFESAFRVISAVAQKGHKLWTDLYLAAFALSTGLRLVTFDKILAVRSPGPILLR